MQSSQEQISVTKGKIMKEKSSNEKHWKSPFEMLKSSSLPKLGLTSEKKPSDTKLPKLMQTNQSISLPKLNEALKEKREFIHQPGFKGINMDSFDQSLIKAKSHRYGALK